RRLARGGARRPRAAGRRWERGRGGHARRGRKWAGAAGRARPRVPIRLGRVRATPIAPGALVAGALLGGGPGTGLARRADPSAAEAPPGKALFAQYCAACHGAEGRGDGPSAASLPTKPWNPTEA